jgi:hypothetical protein
MDAHFLIGHQSAKRQDSDAQSRAKVKKVQDDLLKSCTKLIGKLILAACLTVRVERPNKHQLSLAPLLFFSVVEDSYDPKEQH